MDTADEILNHLPRIRRFGCMLLGGSTDADVIIKKSIESLIADLSGYASADDKLIYLFKLFVSFVPASYSRRTLNGSNGAAFSLAKYLPELTWQELQVFLLLFVEEFDVSATAEIMGISERLVLSLEKSAEVKASCA